MAKKIQGEDGKVYVEKKPIYKRWWFIALAVLVVLGIAGSLTGGGDTDSTTPTTTAEDSSNTADKLSTANKNKVDKKALYEKFLSIEPGATVESINQLFGIEGTEESSIQGSKSYEWKLGGLKTVNVEFDDNGNYTGKSQAGLDFMSTDLTKEMYDTIQEGMTYDQVKEIIGTDGSVLSVINLLGTETTDYHWNGKKGGFINLTIQDGAVASKAQNGLK